MPMASGAAGYDCPTGDNQLVPWADPRATDVQGRESFGRDVVAAGGGACLTTIRLLIVTAVLFLVLYPIVWGVSGLAFYEVVSKVIPPRLRAPFFSWRMALGGLFALGASAFIERVLAPESSLGFPRNYALIFAAAAIVTLLGLQTFHMLREPESEAHPPERHGLRASLAEVRGALREDRLFARFVWARVAILLAAGTAPLIIIYGQSSFGLPLSAAPLFLMADTLVGLVTVAVSGWLSLRLGNRWLALVSTGLGLAGFGLLAAAGAILPGSTLVLPYFLVIFILLAVMNGTGNITLLGADSEHSPGGQRPLYVGRSITIFGVASYLNLVQGVIWRWRGRRALWLGGPADRCGLWNLGLFIPTIGGRPGMAGRDEVLAPWVWRAWSRCGPIVCGGIGLALLLAEVWPIRPCPAGAVERQAPAGECLDVVSLSLPAPQAGRTLDVGCYRAFTRVGCCAHGGAGIPGLGSAAAGLLSPRRADGRLSPRSGRSQSPAAGPSRGRRIRRSLAVVVKPRAGR
jgi:hypothetical protein